MAQQRLILCFDGTWNDPQDQTNVYRLSRSLHDYDGPIEQRFFYDPGVGTNRFDKLQGGVFGTGLGKNLLQGYEWLARRYSEGDEIYLFGFSRGAYTARSLVGMLRKCGLLHITTPGLLKAAQALYRDKQARPNGERCQAFRRTYSREVRVHFIGVWDTVGMLGVPGTFLNEKGVYAWHDTELSSIVDRAYQALALDEHRAAYAAALWTHPDGIKKASQLEVEQRWFIGAHANVGGGYGEDPLALIPFAWMQQKARQAGLKLDLLRPAADAYLSTTNDSYAEFLKGIYRAWRKLRQPVDEGRFYRRWDRDNEGMLAVNVSIDPSVWQRWQDDPCYRPPTLLRAGLEPEQEKVQAVG
ncbi:DUF2235 domain-containing protein [Balneatrix alpica]|uniref:DUF2235 domain-containing protein n=1 Tax=Balneatrix alpica TaxID=75684 RepID=A0ABV5ZC08_9GAMM|nr:DUF2235 domain-containing protein [Balneatrix alpica]